MSLQACANLVHRSDPARWRAAMAAPVAARAFLLPIYAANLEISRAPWVTQEAMIAEMRLQWWQDVLDEISSGSPRRHEVVDALAPVLTPDGAAALGETLSARKWDIYRRPFETAEDLFAYTTPTTYGPMAAGYLALGGMPDALGEIQALAIGLGAARFFQGYVDVKDAVGREIMPAWDGEHVSKAAQIALDAFKDAKPILRSKSASAAALIESAGADRFLKHIIKRPNDVFDGTIPAFGPSSALSRARVSFGIKAPGVSS